MIVQFAVDDGREQILVNLRPHSFSVTIDVSTIYNFDATGRLMGAYVRGRNYLRGLSNRILVKWGAGHGLANRSRHDLDEAAKQAFLDETVRRIAAIAGAVRRRQVRMVSGGAAAGDALDAVVQALDRVLGYEALAADGQRFLTIYKPISILPPDQYLALVLQATEGCSWNKCTFCDFYRDRPFRIKWAADFQEHVRAAAAFLGPALALRRSVFLADANALVIEQRLLLALLDIVAAELPMTPPRLVGDERRRWLAEHPGALQGIYSFVDAFTTRHKSEDDYRQMAERGVRRVYIGLESGDDDLLQFLHKGSSAADAVQAVRTIKAAGIDIGVILMLGVGGAAYNAGHVRRSVEALNAMQLDEHDIVYFSPFVEGEQSEYGRLAGQLGLQPLSVDEMDAQMAAMRAGFVWADAKRPPRLAVYDIREFIY